MMTIISIITIILGITCIFLKPLTRLRHKKQILDLIIEVEALRKKQIELINKLNSRKNRRRR